MLGDILDLNSPPPPTIAIIEFIKKGEKEEEEKSIFSALKVWDYFHFSSLCF